jgi:surfeit locus 1 family protein
VPLPRPLRLRYWGVHLLALVLAGSAAGLGAWQYDAWQVRRDAEARDLTQREPVPLAEAIGPDEPFPGDMVGQPVEVSGTWVPAGTVYVSGREQDGREGYWVVTPLRVDGAGSALAVVRGWTPAVGDVPEAPRGQAAFVAWLQPPESSGEPDPDPGDRVLSRLRIADAIQYAGQDLYGAYGVMAQTSTEGLVPAALQRLPDAGRFTALRNILYAIEWWVFGLFALFIWWRWLRDEVLRDDPGERPGQTQ